uniref:Folylpolyglutamate synthase n=1 Tax=Jaculus jaculus TaxID=51337 RepID=A0A8C5KT01_JACJA
MSRALSHLRAAVSLVAINTRCPATEGAARRGLSTWPAPQEPGMEYQDAVRMLNTLQTNASYLEQVKRQRSDPQAQLEAMEMYLTRSGLQVEDLNRLNIIHVTGTKGKVREGPRSDSPHLVQVRERIRLNGQPISPELFTQHFWRLYHRLEETKEDSHVSMPAYFRFLTLMAFHVFLQEKVDLAVVEVGIGGAYDCTNIIRKPVVCGVSSLGIDHTSLLGDTMEKIAWQKGGIFKPLSLSLACPQHGVPAFTVLQPEGPLAVLRERAHQISCPLYLCPPLEALEEGGPPLTLGLEGEHQRSNAALALQLAHCWLQQQDHLDIQELKGSRLSVPHQLPLAPVFQLTSHMRHGLRDAEWPGRTQVLRRGSLIWYLDGAHTTSSMQACVRWFRQAVHGREQPSSGLEVRVLLFNSTGDRDPAALLKLLQNLMPSLPLHFYAGPSSCPLHTCLCLCPADQQNFTVTLDQVLLRCLQHQQHWSFLAAERASLVPDGSASLLLAPHPGSPCSLVFSCISHALQWISQGRDPIFQPPSPSKGLLSHPTASSGASILREAAAIHVLVTGSLHLVGGVLKLLDPSLSQ